MTGTDGFGDGPGVTATPIYSNGIYADTSYGGKSSGEHLYTAGSGAVIALPARTMTYTNTNTSSGTGWTALYTVATSGITFAANLSGTQKGTQEALAGQPITGTLTGGVPAGDSIQGYTWSVSGGSPFSNYDPTLASNQLVPLSAANESSSGFTFYDAVAGTDSVTCAITVSTPSGAQTVSTAPQTVQFVRPTASWGVDPATVPFIYQGDVEKDSPTIGFLDMSPSYFGVSTWWYPVTISVPTPFSGGAGCFAQVVTPTATITRTVQTTNPPPNPPPATSYSFKIQNAAGQWVLPGTGLDGAFPYGYGFAVDANGNVETTVSNGQVTPLKANSSQFSAGNTGASGDAPSCPENPPDLDHGGTNWTSATWKDTFTTWLMYQPPGGVWIPLEKASSWSGGGSASGGPSNWVATPGPGGGYSKPSPTSVTGNAADFPQWTQVLTGVTPHF